MQTSDCYNQRNSLFNTMKRFIGAVNNMDQMVMVPSLLRDVPLDHSGAGKTVSTAANGFTYLDQDADMYSAYVLLKSIRNDMEWGVLRGKGQGKERTGATEGDDLEKQFHHHLNGLHAVLSELTRQADSLTRRYKEEIGCVN
ncbi:Mid1-interacting protein 1 [Scophthalmus maximus]|uniref:Mid1-interacting protein 1 n=1 Tax=Scophthalmus maximus TaxID=52904 RepID=A0A2U9AV05_SCOMX|nr:Mid1-interacting protein 1 [Scophthalmus maximus]KAF0046338.1 hypothetical protein F2P81_002867 [Scophthalmus maximus]